MKPNAYIQINIQLVFSVSKREYLILPCYEERLYEYMGGILKEKRHYPLAINGHLDHVHLFFELNPREALSDLVRDLKANTSKWIHQNHLLPCEFSWQSGYGAFSYSRSQQGRVIRYIENQHEHHRKKTFKKEYLDTLNWYGIEFKDEYLFEFFDDISNNGSPFLSPPCG